MNFNDVDSFEEIQLEDDIRESNEEVHVMSNIDFTSSKLLELQSWKDNNVYNEVEDNGQNTISVRWVCTVKNTDNGPFA